MYELFTLDFFKNHSARVSIDESNIVLGSYEDISFNSIENEHEAEKLLNINMESTFYKEEEKVYTRSEIDCPSNMLVLYSLENTKKKDCMSPHDLWEKCSENNFIGVTLLSCHNLPTKELVKKVADIHSCAKEYKVLCSCLGTLGIYKYCILFCSNDIKNIVNFSNNVQKYIVTNKNQTSTSYTLVICRYNNALNYLSNKECDLIANIQITYKNSLTAQIVLNKLSEELKLKKNDCAVDSDEDNDEILAYTTLGEYDICIHVPAHKLPLSLYKNNGLLCSESPFYKNNILQSCTRIAKKTPLNSIIQANKEPIEEPVAFSNAVSANENEIKKAAKEIAAQLNEIANKNGFNKNKTLQRLFNLINIDFQKAFSLSHDRERASDLKYIFKSTISCLENLAEDTDSNAYEVAAELADILSNTIYNVFQNSTYIISEPYSFLHNSSVFQDVLQSYIGFVKSFLVVLYLNCSCKQSELVPVVSFDCSVTVPKSKLFIYKENEKDLGNSEKDDSRIIYIQLPIDATTNGEIYLPLLVHEIMHYVCPVDRCERNKMILKIYMKHYFSLMLNDLIEAEDELSPLLAETDLNNFVLGYIDEAFNNLYYEMRTYNILPFDSVSMSFSDSIQMLFDTTFSKYKNEWDEKLDGNVFKSDYLFEIFYNLYKCFKNKQNLKASSTETVRGNIVKNCKNSKYIAEAADVINGIKEEICDTMMINCFDLSVDAYFALLIIAMLNQNISKTDHVITIVRIGSILKNTYRLDLDKFDLNDYSNKIKSIIFRLNPDFAELDISKRIDTIITDIKLTIEKYKSRYEFYIVDINTISQCYNFNGYCKIISPVTFITEKYESSISTFFYVSKIIKKMFKYVSFDSTKTSFFRAHIQIKIMGYLCDQLSLKEIREFYDASLNSRKLTDNVVFVPNLKPTNVKPSAPYKFYMNKYGIEKAIHKTRKTLLDSEHPTETLWYRGQPNEGWEVYPSLYRKKCGGHFLELQTTAYELFRAQACDSIEIHSNTLTDADWIACMQHYLLPTNFLDWSEQPLTSLYFALENYCTPFCPYQEDNMPTCNKGKCDYSSNAVLYILNPYRMNRLFKQIPYIPNISVPQNLKKYSEFILPSTDSLCPFVIHDKCDIFPDKFKGKVYPLSPMAVITSNMSSRIKAQKGHFVAYNLSLRFENQDDESQEKSPKLRSILDLYAMEEYLYEQNVPNFEPFIVKLVIPKDLKPSIAETLRSYGIKKSDMYPELMNIGTDISNLLFNSYK